MKRLHITKAVLYLFIGLGIAATILRYLYGLGPSTGLSDSDAWGLWDGFIIVAGVALAAGGFVLTAAIYIFGKHEYRYLLRAAVLTALLGYLLEPTVLLLDLGLPLHMWHPLIYWQPTSALFTVGLCVIFYSVVVALIFAPTALEHPLLDIPPFQKIYKTLNRFMPAIIIIGVVIAVIHQSMLGALFLVMPLRVNPLWYSPILPIHFLFSSIALACGVIIFESTATSYLYGRPPKLALLAKLGQACSILLGLYVAVRLGDLAVRGKLPDIFLMTRPAAFFSAEIVLGAILPAVLFLSKKIRSSSAGLFCTSLLVVAGIIMNRLNVSIFTMFNPTGHSYVPSLIELSSSIGLLCAGALGFLFSVEKFNLFEGARYHTPRRQLPPGSFSKHEFAGPLGFLDRTGAFSAIFILSIALGLALFSQTVKPDKRHPATPVKKAQANPNGDVLRINGGSSRSYVDFNHKAHQDSIGKQDSLGVKGSCPKCHHLNFSVSTARHVSDTEITPCYLCHSDMYRAASIFNHAAHQAVFKKSGSCRTCHPQERSARTFRPCKDCHPGMFPQPLAARPQQFVAPSYMDAMHAACIECHKAEWPKLGKPTPEYCNSCHKDMEGDIWKNRYGHAENDFKAAVERARAAADSAAAAPGVPQKK